MAFDTTYQLRPGGTLHKHLQAKGMGGRIQPKNVRCYTYGQPKVFSVSFCNAVNPMDALVEDYWRVTNQVLESAGICMVDSSVIG